MMKVLLWKIRSSKRVTLMELSRCTGISKTLLNDIENGKVSPRLSALESIAKCLGVRITDLFESDYK